MKVISVFLLVLSTALAGCSSTSTTSADGEEVKTTKKKVRCMKGDRQAGSRLNRGCKN